jgi:hypothetical protein
VGRGQPAEPGPGQTTTRKCCGPESVVKRGAPHET